MVRTFLMAGIGTSFRAGATASVVSAASENCLHICFADATASGRADVRATTRVPAVLSIFS
jgi:hypothetical protein